jgi:hypothetical protein
MRLGVPPVAALEQHFWAMIMPQPKLRQPHALTERQ